MEEYHILIIGDSRTRHLSQVLNKTTLNVKFHVRSVSGARMRHITLKAITELAYYNEYHLVILMAGINDVSKLLRHPSRHAVPRFESVYETVMCTMHEMRTAVNKVSRFTTSPVVIASLPGMDLVKYSPWLHRKLYPLQPILDDAIIQINHQIRGLNRFGGMLTPDLSSVTNRCHGRGGFYRSHYLHLIDGLHPGYMLRERWALKIISYCTRFLPAVYHLQEKMIYD